MKKTIVSIVFLLTLLGLGSLSYGDEVAQVGKGKGKIKLLPNSGQSTKPCNPTGEVDKWDGNNQGTGNLGPLSVDYVPNITFGKQPVHQENHIFSALNEESFIQVTDTRGESAGWVLKAQLAPFVSLNKKEVLKSAILIISEGIVMPVSDDNVSDAPKSIKAILDDGEKHEVLNAEDGAGRGSWSVRWDGQDDGNNKWYLVVKKGSAKKNTSYRGTISWTLENIP